MTGLEAFILANIAVLGTSTLTANALYLGSYALIYGGLAYAASLLVPKPSVPKPEDGKYNLKQPVPPLSFALGRVKKGSDYAFLEEKDGTAYHILVWAGHRIEGYVDHYLHDEKVTLDGSGDVTAPGHFQVNTKKYVNIQTRLGQDVSTAYADIVSAFPGIWSEDHRGDGLATVQMICKAANLKRFQKVYPSQMPQHSAVGNGARLYDPRTDSTAFSKNLALMRLWHLTHPVGGKLGLDDLYLPDWENAADVCDSNVTNRDSDTENRYHGGLWFYANTDPVQVGKTIDQAGELVVYERPDGLIGVHAGEYVAPDIRLTANDIVRCTHDVNQRLSTTLLAVRGQWTDPGNNYVTSDAAIWGDPYIGEDTERSFTLQNAAVQSHNHMQRMQKLAFIRRNAPRVTIVAHYEPAKNVSYRRFVKVHLPPRLDEAIIEITASPKLSLKNLTVEFSGIVVSAGLYDFNAEEEEGQPPPLVDKVDDSVVPVPTGFDITLKTESVGGSNDIAYVLADWDHVDDEYLYELEWQATGGPDTDKHNAISEEGEDSQRSGYLIDGQEYRFRLRTWAGSSPSEWTAYETLTITADAVAPGTPSFSLTSAAPHLGFATFAVTAPNDLNLKRIKFYRKATGVALDVNADTPFKNMAVAPNASFNFTDGDDTRINQLTNGDFPGGVSTGWTLGANWSAASGAAVHTPGSTSTIFQVTTLTPVGTVFRYSLDVSGTTAGQLTARLAGGTTVSGTAMSANGSYQGKRTSVSGNVTFSMIPTTTFDGAFDNAVLFPETADCAPQGVWDYYAVAFNGSGVASVASGPLTVTVI
jgi:hypothetical protein